MRYFILTSLYLLISLTATGQSFKKELSKAKSGNPMSMNYIGRCYFNGEEVKRDYKKAFEWHYKAANLGIPNSQYIIGVMYMKGVGVEQNTEKSIEWFKKGAYNNDENSCFMMGQYYINQEIPNYKDACFYLHKADSLGCRESSYLLYQLYMNGQYVKQNNSLAYKYLCKATEFPNQFQAKAVYDLGICYEQGMLGVSQNENLKTTCFLKSAKMGNKFAQNAIADCYYSGSGIQKNIEYAKKWYKESADQGLAEANYKLGKCYWAEGDTLSALNQWKNGIKLNDSNSLYALAQYYFYDANNTEKAVQFYKYSADLGFAPAQYVISLFYFDGISIEKNIEMGLDYLLKSAEQGYDEAIKLIEELSK